MISLEDIAAHLEEARVSATYVLGRCPFHDDTHPSLWVGQKGRFKCYGCGVSGTVEYLWSRISGNTVQASETKHRSWRIRGSLEEYVEEKHQTLVAVPSLQEYLRRRKLDDMIVPAKLGWDDGWYVIPVFGPEKVEGVVWRADSHTQKATGMRYLTPAGQPPLLMRGTHVRCGQIGTSGSGPASNGFGMVLWIVFGTLDVLCLSKFKVACVTATGGKNSFNPSWADTFRCKVNIWPDKGEEETARKLARQLDWRGRVVEIEWPDDSKDVNDLLVNGHEDIVAKVLGV